MPFDVLEAHFLHDYVVWVRFRDGTAGEVDLAPVLGSGVFEPLRDPKVFQSFRLHPQAHTLTWPNGADLAPEFLHAQVNQTAGT